jgi:hypothetical protein
VPEDTHDLYMTLSDRRAGGEDWWCRMRTRVGRWVAAVLYRSESVRRWGAAVLYRSESVRRWVAAVLYRSESVRRWVAAVLYRSEKSVS